jgi:hypothetical protein
VAKTFVYKGLKEREDVPADYAAKAKQICYQRVALAGYRLGMIIDQIYRSFDGS